MKSVAKRIKLRPFLANLEGAGNALTISGEANEAPTPTSTTDSDEDAPAIITKKESTRPVLNDA